MVNNINILIPLLIVSVLITILILGNKKGSIEGFDPDNLTLRQLRDDGYPSWEHGWKSPDNNCTGEWSTCDVDCNKKYTITQPSNGLGDPCEFLDQEVKGCEPGEGECAVPDVNCTGSWGECNNMCMKQYTVSIPKSGNGLDCEKEDGAVTICQLSGQQQGECLPNSRPIVIQEITDSSGNIKNVHIISKLDTDGNIVPDTDFNPLIVSEITDESGNILTVHQETTKDPDGNIIPNEQSPPIIISQMVDPRTNESVTVHTSTRINSDGTVVPDVDRPSVIVVNQVDISTGNTVRVETPVIENDQGVMVIDGNSDPVIITTNIDPNTGQSTEVRAPVEQNNVITINGEISFNTELSNISNIDEFKNDFKNKIIEKYSQDNISLNSNNIIITSIESGSVIVKYKIEVICLNDCETTTSTIQSINNSIINDASQGNLVVSSIISNILSNDCVGSWSECDVNCNKTFTIQNEAGEGGLPCDNYNGEVQQCNIGEGQCACKGGWGNCETPPWLRYGGGTDHSNNTPSPFTVSNKINKAFKCTEKLDILKKHENNENYSWGIQGSRDVNEAKLLCDRQNIQRRSVWWGKCHKDYNGLDAPTQDCGGMPSRFLVPDNMNKECTSIAIDNKCHPLMDPSDSYRHDDGTYSYYFCGDGHDNVSNPQPRVGSREIEPNPSCIFKPPFRYIKSEYRDETNYTRRKWIEDDRTIVGSPDPVRVSNEWKEWRDNNQCKSKYKIEEQVDGITCIPDTNEEKTCSSCMSNLQLAMQQVISFNISKEEWARLITTTIPGTEDIYFNGSTGIEPAGKLINTHMHEKKRKGIFDDDYPKILNFTQKNNRALADEIPRLPKDRENWGGTRGSASHWIQKFIRPKLARILIEEFKKIEGFSKVDIEIAGSNQKISMDEHDPRKEGYASSINELNILNDVYPLNIGTVDGIKPDELDENGEFIPEERYEGLRKQKFKVSRVGMTPDGVPINYFKLIDDNYNYSWGNFISMPFTYTIMFRAPLDYVEEAETKIKELGQKIMLEGKGVNNTPLRLTIPEENINTYIRPYEDGTRNYTESKGLKQNRAYPYLRRQGGDLWPKKREERILESVPMPLDCRYSTTECNSECKQRMSILDVGKNGGKECPHGGVDGEYKCPFSTSPQGQCPAGRKCHLYAEYLGRESEDMKAGIDTHPSGWEEQFAYYLYGDDAQRWNGRVPALRASRSPTNQNSLLTRNRIKQWQSRGIAGGSGIPLPLDAEQKEVWKPEKMGSLNTINGVFKRWDQKKQMNIPNNLFELKNLRDMCIWNCSPDFRIVRLNDIYVPGESSPADEDCSGFEGTARHMNDGSILNEGKNIEFIASDVWEDTGTMCGTHKKWKAEGSGDTVRTQYKPGQNSANDCNHLYNNKIIDENGIINSPNDICHHVPWDWKIAHDGQVIKTKLKQKNNFPESVSQQLDEAEGSGSLRVRTWEHRGGRKSSLFGTPTTSSYRQTSYADFRPNVFCRSGHIIPGSNDILRELADNNEYPTEITQHYSSTTCIVDWGRCNKQCERTEGKQIGFGDDCSLTTPPDCISGEDDCP